MVTSACPAQEQPGILPVRHMRTSAFISALVVIFGLVLLGCGDAGDDVAGITTTSSTAPSTTVNEAMPGTAATLGIASTNLGDVLVTESGRTLYIFTPDGSDGATCVDACAQTWPPLTTEGAPSGKDIEPGLLGTVERQDGSTQVTAAGHPLYTYSGDTEEGDTNGEGIDGTWFAASNSGKPIKKSPSSDQVPLTHPY